MIAYIALPALAALIVKLALLSYAIRQPMRSGTTRLFLVLLALMALHNLTEFFMLNHFAQNGLTATARTLGFAYMALIIPVFALILHVSFRLSFDLPDDDRRVKLLSLLYLPAVALLMLLLFTDQLVLGFKPFKNTALRIPGPWYPLFEIFAVGCMTAALLCLGYGARNGRAAFVARRRSQWWLLALSPTALLTIYLIIANHFNLAKVTSTIYIPITWTFFLIVATYATTGSWRSLPIQQQRLFDIAFFIPGSKARRGKKALYAGIRTTVAQFANLPSLDEALARVAELLRCPVALVGGYRPMLVHAGEGSLQIAQFPHEELPKIDRVLVVHEIAESMPRTHQLMRQFGIGAIVPFYPYSRTSTTWMLLGDSFNDTVYTPLDFKNVEQLFDGLKELFLDKLFAIHSEIGKVQQQARTAEERRQEIEKNLDTVREENALLRDTNFRLLRENHVVRQALDSRPRPNKPAPVLKLAPKLATDWSKTLREQLEQSEARLIEEALRQSNGNKSEAARLLGIRPNTLHYKLERFGLTAPKAKPLDEPND